MTKRKARQVHAAALASYQRGYIDGTEARIWLEQNPGKNYRVFGSEGGLYTRDERPAYWAGHNLGREGARLRPDVLPLDVWVRVLANELKP